MTTTCECGATVPVSARWCSLCHRPVADVRFTATPDVDAGAPALRRDAPSLAEQVRERGRSQQPVGRFARTDVTFGLRGRLVMTIVVLLPFWFFVVHFATGGWIGVVVLAFVGLPWALRDIWRRSDRL